MSRTFRNTQGMNRYYFRSPHTFNEIRQLDGLLHDEDLEDFPVSGLNHMKSREHNLPTVRDDIVVSSYYEEDFKF